MQGRPTHTHIQTKVRARERTRHHTASLARSLAALGRSLDRPGIRKQLLQSIWYEIHFVAECYPVADATWMIYCGSIMAYVLPVLFQKGDI